MTDLGFLLAEALNDGVSNLWRGEAQLSTGKRRLWRRFSRWSLVLSRVFVEK